MIWKYSINLGHSQYTKIGNSLRTINKTPEGSIGLSPGAPMVHFDQIPYHFSDFLFALCMFVFITNKPAKTFRKMADFKVLENFDFTFTRNVGFCGCNLTIYIFISFLCSFSQIYNTCIWNISKVIKRSIRKTVKTASTHTNFQFYKKSMYICWTQEKPHHVNVTAFLFLCADTVNNIIMCPVALYNKTLSQFRINFRHHSQEVLFAALFATFNE